MGLARKKAQALDTWRLQAARRAEQTQPNALSPVDEQQLQRDLDTARLNAKQRTANVKASAQQQLSASQQQESTKRQAIDQQERVAVDNYAQSRRSLDQALAQTQKRLAELQVTLGTADQMVDSFALITLMGLVRFVTFGK